MEKEASIPRVWKSRTAQYRQQMLISEHRRHRHSLEGTTKNLLKQSINDNLVYGTRSQCGPLCLKQVICELQQDFILTHKLPLRISETENHASLYSRSLPNISDLRLTEVALQNATAYKQNGKLLNQCNSSSSLESILKEKINYSRRKWRHYTEPGKYNHMWQTLGRDVQDRQENRKGDKTPGNVTAHRNVRGKDQLTKTKLNNNSKENLSTHLSKQGKNLNPGSRYRSPRQVLPRILFTWLNSDTSVLRIMGNRNVAWRIVEKKTASRLQGHQ